MNTGGPCLLTTNNSNIAKSKRHNRLIESVDIPNGDGLHGACSSLEISNPNHHKILTTDPSSTFKLKCYVMPNKRSHIGMLPSLKKDLKGFQDQVLDGAID